MAIEYSYNLNLVALSFAVSVFGSFTALQLVTGVREYRQRESRVSLPWLVSSALALGGGAIWSMHFIGMLAYQTPIEIGYDPLTTFLSLVVAVVVVGIGIYIVSAGPLSIARSVMAGIFTGVGVASMHYAGMSAMVMPADMVFDAFLVGVSVVIAVVAATAALWLAFTLTGFVEKLGSAVIMGLAVCGMHYTGMAAMTMVPNDTVIETNSGMPPLVLGFFIFCAAMVLLFLFLIGAMRRLEQNFQIKAVPQNETVTELQSQS